MNGRGTSFSSVRGGKYVFPVLANKDFLYVKREVMGNFSDTLIVRGRLPFSFFLI